jgi:hypothetical protein
VPDRVVAFDRELDIEHLLIAAVVEVADAALDDEPCRERGSAASGEDGGDTERNRGASDRT